MAPERKPGVSLYTHQESEKRTKALGEWMGKNGVKAVLFDLDDTLVNTSPIIRDLEKRYVQFVVDQCPGLDPIKVLETLHQQDFEVYMSHSVSKARWSALAHKLVDAYGTRYEDTFHKGLAIFMSLYTTLPDLMPGAISTVQMFRAVSEKMGVVTHADEYWTTMKLDRTGLSTYFDVTYIVPDDERKNAKHWGQAIAKLGVEPHEVLVIGDSVSGDIRAAAEAGVRQLVLVPGQWSPYQSGELPVGVKKADGIERVIDSLIGNTA